MPKAAGQAAAYFFTAGCAFFAGAPDTVASSFRRL
jgi:hypothetical protein